MREQSQSPGNIHLHFRLNMTFPSPYCYANVFPSNYYIFLATFGQVQTIGLMLPTYNAFILK